MWNWTDAYPGSRAVTLILDVAEADLILDRAAFEGRLIAPGTVLGLPESLKGEPLPTLTITAKPDISPETKAVLVKTAEKAAAQFKAGKRGKAANPTPCRDDGPVVFTEKRPIREEPNTVAKKVDPADRALIDQAIAAGRVKKCPAYTFSTPAGEVPPEYQWKRKRGRPKKR